MAHRNRWFSQLETSIYNGFSMAMLNNQMVFKHVLFSIIVDGIILPIDELIFFKMVIAPPTSNGYQ